MAWQGGRDGGNQARAARHHDADVTSASAPQSTASRARSLSPSEEGRNAPKEQTQRTNDAPPEHHQETRDRCQRRRQRHECIWSDVHAWSLRRPQANSGSDFLAPTIPLLAWRAKARRPLYLTTSTFANAVVRRAVWMPSGRRARPRRSGDRQFMSHTTNIGMAPPQQHVGPTGTEGARRT